jgi:hypothetical protein
MNFQFYAEKLKASGSFKKFTKQNKAAFLCSCFFVLDKEEGKDEQHFDFYIPSSNKMFSFSIEKDAEKKEIEIKELQIPAEISISCDFNFEEIEEVIKRKMEKEKISQKIQKILLSLQNVDGKDLLIGTVFISSFGLINLKIDVKNNEIIDFKKRTFFDMMNIFKKDR